MVKSVFGPVRNEVLAIPMVNHAGLKATMPPYERLINVVHDAALASGKRLCGPFAWLDRPDFTCFQNGSETAAIERGVATELPEL